MLGSILIALNPFFSLALNSFSQVITYRYIKKWGLLRTVYLGFALGSLISLSLSMVSVNFKLFKSEALLFLGVNNLIIYILLSYCYFHFINLGETARRIRILNEIFYSKDGLYYSELLSRYNSAEIFNNRASRLIGNGQLILKEGRYYIGSPVMLIFARIIVLLKIIVLGKISEFS